MTDNTAIENDLVTTDMLSAIVAESLRQDPKDPSNISTALLALGQILLMQEAPPTWVSILRKLTDNDIMLHGFVFTEFEDHVFDAATLIKQQMEEVQTAIDAVNPSLAEDAESLLIYLLDLRDELLVKVEGIRALGRPGITEQARRYVLDVIDPLLIGRQPNQLPFVSWQKEEKLKATLLGDHSIWNKVPDPETVEPHYDPDLAGCGDLTDKDLRAVYQGRADEFTELRVSRTIELDATVRERYDLIAQVADGVAAAEEVRSKMTPAELAEEEKQFALACELDAEADAYDDGDT